MRVVNVRDYGGRKAAEQEGVVYVGRGTVLGNPFVMKRESDRDRCVEDFRKWLWARIRAKDERVIASLLKLKEGDLLGCWCAPKNCQARVIVAAVRWLRSQSEF